MVHVLGLTDPIVDEAENLCGRYEDARLVPVNVVFDFVDLSRGC